MSAALQAVGLLLMIDSAASYQAMRLSGRMVGAHVEGGLILLGAVVYWLGAGGLEGLI